MAPSTSEGEALRTLRRGAALTQSELASRVGTTQSAIARWERGAVAPSLVSVRRLAAACGHRVTFAPAGDEPLVLSTDEVARLEANARLSPAQRLARATTAANFVLRARRSMATARGGAR